MSKHQAWDVYVQYGSGVGPFLTKRQKNMNIPIPASWDNVDAAQEYAAKKLRVAKSRVGVEPASRGANRAKPSALTEAQKKERAGWRAMGDSHGKAGREPIFVENPTGGIDAISILARPTFISETAAGRAYLRGYGKRAYLRDSDDSANRARSPARSRLGKQALPKATETRVATLASLGVSYDPSLFYSVKGGKLLVRQRKAGKGLGAAKVLGPLPGFRKGLFYFVKNGVVVARRRASTGNRAGGSVRRASVNGADGADAQPKSITLIGRRWQRGPGNTYHSVEIIVDGKHVHKIPFGLDRLYGYGDQWEDNAAAWLDENGYLPGYERPLWRYTQDRDIHYERTVTDVARRKDL